MKIYTFTHNEKFKFDVQECNGESFLELDGNKLNLGFNKISENRYMLIKDNRTYRINISESEEGFNVDVDGDPFHVIVEDEQSRKMKELMNAQSTGHSEKEIKAQIPGLIVDILVKSGGKVKTGTPLLILEAMKMENVIKAPFDCEIMEIKVAPKETVNQNQPMVRIRSV